MLRMSKYANWSKEALISKLVSLENAYGISGDSRASSPESSASSAPTTRPKPRQKPKLKEIDFSKYAKRRVAIRFAYLGWNYHGLAFQKEGHKTVEREILQAFYKTKCIPSMDPNQCNFSRCGRTDADVSAMAQVISLDVRSVVPAEEHTNPAMDDKELDYLKILNSNLPGDILAYQIALRPTPGFDARFSCTGRHYHYYFDPANLDLDAMQKAADMLVGEHDFRNFCKIDGSKQITNFSRCVREAKICKQEGPNGLHYLSLRGTAFLWNQVRSIMAILFLVGQNLEQPAIVERLLNIEQTPRRPAYEIAWGVPLVLINCEFPPMDWRQSSYTSTEPARTIYHEHLLKQAVTQSMIDSVSPFSAPLTAADLKSRQNVGQGIGRRSARYTRLLDRPLCETPEVVNQRWLERRQLKQAEESS